MIFALGCQPVETYSVHHPLGRSSDDGTLHLMLGGLELRARSEQVTWSTYFLDVAVDVLSETAVEEIPFQSARLTTESGETFQADHVSRRDSAGRTRIYFQYSFDTFALDILGEHFEISLESEALDQALVLQYHQEP